MWSHDPICKGPISRTISNNLYLVLGSKVYEKVAGILTNTQLLNDIKKLSNDAQTSCLEGYHAPLNFWHPKMICFSWMGTYCRYKILLCTNKGQLFTCVYTCIGRRHSSLVVSVLDSSLGSNHG